MFELGQSITYVLKPRDLPANPNREYHGIIIGIDGNRLHVQLTEEKYLGFDEWIDAGQVRKIGEQNGEQNGLI